MEGGHYVDPETLCNNFYGNLEKLNLYHRLIDDLTIVDTSEINHRILFKTVNRQLEFAIEQHKLPEWFTKHLPSIIAMFP
ncbi:hypothetical protein GCM10023231_37850 [Olivibacter ginsenosidimutans]|uniref:Uncharacterized protein n=1 Tax=Olivibacter ginsenosidimutans TaxID=1176537 RepID=A0ABP9C9T5_9SPHI